MRRSNRAYSLSVTIMLAVAIVVGQAYLPIGPLSGIATAEVEAPVAQPSPSPDPARGAAPRAARSQPGPSAAGTPANPHHLPVPPPASRQFQERELEEHFPVGRATFRQLKGQARREADAEAAGRRPEAPPGRGSEPAFPTLDRTESNNGIDNSIWNPPDAALAVGPSSLLVGVNESFAIYDRSGARQLGPVGFGKFFKTSGSTFDPRALYDASNAAPGGYGGGNGRFVLLATTGSEYALAVSRNDRPDDETTDWCTYRLNAVIGSGTAATYADFPGLGMDGDNLFITSNQYSNDGVVAFARLLIVPKASAYPDVASSACPTATSQDVHPLEDPSGGLATTVQPATQPDALPGQASMMYLVSAMWPDGSNLAVHRVTRAADGTYSSVANWVSSGFIAPYTLPADARQPRGSIDTFDTRLLGAVYRYGKIYTANTTRTVHRSLANTANAYANVQWYTVTPDPTDPTKSIGASFAVTNRSVAYFIPAVLPGCPAAATGGCSSPYAGLQISGSGPSQPASAYLVRAAAGSSPTVSLYQAGVSGYGIGDRWGDYPAMAADPTDARAVWVLGEYAKGDDRWGTAVATIRP